jgi:N,N-dimethylformamidase
LAGGGFDGRLEAPRLVAGLLSRDQLDALAADDPPVAGWWDFSHGIPTDAFADLSPHRRHGVLRNLPTRAVTGRRWTGEVHDWRHAPEQYAAVHFHRDDLADAGWQPDFELRVPDDWPSGLYAVRLRQGEHEDHVQFFVRPPRGRSRADLLFLVPTASYLAYANHTIHLRPGPLVRVPPEVPLPNDATLLAHPEFGLSQYDYHHDGSGVVFSSRLRPVMNLKSKNVPWGFVADTRLSAWLEREEIPFDVATDEDLHAEGVDLLRRYRAVMTGTHPEYWSTRMLDALTGWLGQGGRLLYMGGNGFYWRVAFDADHPGVMEVRRAEDGTRAWIAEPGESYHQWGGEYGGLWRRIGRPPDLVCGVGFAAQGFGHTVGYERTAASEDPRAAFLFDGVEGRSFGRHGRLDSPSGEEIDRFDLRLGSPPHALVVATATEQPAEMLKTKEEYHMTEVASASDPAVRNDVVFFECPNGGAVFSTGSINWGAALAFAGGDNGVARVTRNAVRRFLDPRPFPELPPP